MWVKKDFVNSMVRIILDDKCKTNVNSLFYDRNYFLMYNAKTTEPRQFPDPEIFHINNF